MSKTPQLLKDRRYGIFYAFTASIIAGLLAIQEVIDGDTESHLDILLEFLMEIPAFFVICFIIGVFASIIIKWLDTRFPWEERSFERLIFEISIVFFLVAMVTIFSSIGEEILDQGGEELDYDKPKFQVLITFLCFIAVSMVFAFHEYISLSEDKKVITEVAKELEKQNYISRYEALRNQVNPHFLFNSLNVLSSLIYSDIEMSDKFIHKFSDVFRYVLELNNEEVVTLKKEIDFVNSYFFLQKIRHKDAVHLNINVKNSDLELMLPPMALQIVMENAFKHNVISTSAPLHISITSKGNKLSVVNNYQSREDTSIGTGIGQRNLKERYAMLSDALPEFYIEDGNYVVELPIIKKDHKKWKS